MGRRKTGVAVAMGVLVFAGCASAGTSTGRSSSSVLAAEELASVAELNCYQALQRLRPAWLRVRGQVTIMAQQGVRVYVDGIQRGYVRELEGIPAGAVEQMRFLSGREATARYGTDHTDGAILVTLRRG